MENLNLNKIEKMWHEGKLSSKNAVNKIALFISENTPVFNLNKYDDDFKSDVILSFLEKGEKLLENYNPKLGSFFSFLCSNLQSIICYQLKKNAQLLIKDLCMFGLSVNEYEGRITKYQNMDFSEIETSSNVYSLSKTDFNKLKAEYKKLQDQNMKIIVILLLKSAYFINDMEVREICRQMNFNYSLLQPALEYSRNLLTDKINRNKKTEEARNKSYFFHKKYESQIQKIKDSFTEDFELKTEDFQKKLSHHTKIWNSKNQLLEKQFSRLSVANKDIAEILGICERQVRYCVETSRSKNFKFNVEVSINLFNKKIRKTEQDHK